MPSPASAASPPFAALRQIQVRSTDATAPRVKNADVEVVRHERARDGRCRRHRRVPDDGGHVSPAPRLVIIPHGWGTPNSKPARAALMARRSAVQWLGTLAACSLGCGGLSKDGARELLVERFAAARPRSCVWTHAHAGSYIDVDYRSTRECVQELEGAAFIRRGGCRDENPGGPTCVDRAVEPMNGAVATDRGIAFPCGELELVKVKNVEMPDSDHAEVSYDRDFDAALLEKLGHCEAFLLHPTVGRSAVDLPFTRDADGKWHIPDFIPDHTL
jgi:hypothetical protein